MEGKSTTSPSDLILDSSGRGGGKWRLLGLFPEGGGEIGEDQAVDQGCRPEGDEEQGAAADEKTDFRPGEGGDEETEMKPLDGKAAHQEGRDNEEDELPCRGKPEDGRGGEPCGRGTGEPPEKTFGGTGLDPMIDIEAEHGGSQEEKAQEEPRNGPGCADADEKGGGYAEAHRVRGRVGDLPGPAPAPQPAGGYPVKEIKDHAKKEGAHRQGIVPGKGNPHGQYPENKIAEC